jgi:hypothetical protein
VTNKRVEKNRTQKNQIGCTECGRYEGKVKNGHREAEGYREQNEIGGKRVDRSENR